MKKKLIKILFIILFVLIFGTIIGKNVFALNQLTEAITDPGKLSPEEPILDIANPILTLIQIVSAGIAVALIIVDGFKLLTAVDNTEKANLKRKILYYFIGGFLIFAPVTIIKILSTGADLIN